MRDRLRGPAAPEPQEAAPFTQLTCVRCSAIKDVGAGRCSGLPAAFDVDYKAQQHLGPTRRSPSRSSPVSSAAL
ncbi:hypothetical protein NDU88_006765 [Pleurodeles waltl]|uniref:Uncharacterized protein n=1 Tax=Pleurodeles waltl TaxID=8319 RepID=A0AAV7WEX9_PLEWA|nr:hypothetical protein NDU88_006765 [Pleurodeles waltl]